MFVLGKARAAWDAVTGGTLFVLKVMWTMIIALKRATWDQCVETVQHLADPRLSPWPKLALVAAVSASMVGAVLMWVVLHGLLPILLLSPIEEVVLTALILCHLWEYNKYARRKLSEMGTAETPPVVVQEPAQERPPGEGHSLLEPPAVLEDPSLRWAQERVVAKRKVGHHEEES